MLNMSLLFEIAYVIGSFCFFAYAVWAVRSGRIQRDAEQLKQRYREKMAQRAKQNK